MAGRHRANGRAAAPYARTWSDEREHRSALRLTADCPTWFVFWGPYWRCWSAFARFGPAPLVVHALDPHTLTARMREAELAVGMRSG